MKAQVEISLYPLRTSNIGKPIGRSVELLRRNGLKVQVGPMSTQITADSNLLFAKLGGAFQDAASRGGVVLLSKVSNACASELN